MPQHSQHATTDASVSIENYSVSAYFPPIVASLVEGHGFIDAARSWGWGKPSKEKARDERKIRF
ncbi:MAG: hypothetical protein MI741_20320, partial [Rhodospirillales bacterium]|nr:hypothetical protein [Rhodospirillales bacterium]